MSYKRVKNVAGAPGGEDDAFDDDYEEEEEQMSPEDKEKLQQGTIHVRALLGPSSAVTDKEIEDAVWYYYFDVDQTVKYLQRKSNPTPTKEKQEKKTKSRFDMAAEAASQRTPQECFEWISEMAGLDMPNSARKETFTKSLTLRGSAGIRRTDFFWDTPWGAIPEHRLGALESMSSPRRGGLLGGSSKPSKLAALAAARKKKNEEKKQSQPSQSSELDRAVGLLDRLGSKKSLDASPVPETKMRKTPPPVSLKPVLRSKQIDDTPKVEAEPEPPQAPLHDRHCSVQQGQPTAFAQTLFGSRHKKPIAMRFLHPYVDNPKHTSADPFAKPSPDDIVIAAQSKAKNLHAKVPDSGKKVAPKREKKADDGSTSEDLAADTSALSLEGVVSSPKHKRSNVVEEYEKSNMKKSLSFVVVGHVDHGKSTLMGRLLYELKIVSENAVRKLQRDSDKIGKGSFALAWVMDATSDERTRGVTVDTATRFFETDKTKFTILDAPGHRDFIPNMIAGAAQADFAVLVVDAGPNAFESGLRGQTREHALLARSAGVQRLVVAVNKMDRAGWDEARFNEIRQQTGAFLAAAGFPTSDVSFVPVAGLTGENLTTPPGDGKAAWYKGPTLLAELDGTRPASRRVDAPLRMTVSEIGRGGAGSSSVSVTGRIEAGNVQPGDAVLVQPSGRRATVRALLGADDDAAAEWAVAGQTVTLRLAGFSADDSGGAAGGDEDLAQLVRPGSVVCAVDAPARNLRAFRAKVLALEHVLPQAVEVHRGRLQAAGRVAALVVELDKVTGQPKEAAAGGEKGRRKKGRPRVLQPGTVALVDVVLAEAMPLEAGNRVVLRAEGVSIAAGLVEQEVEAEGL